MITADDERAPAAAATLDRLNQLGSGAPWRSTSEHSSPAGQQRHGLEVVRRRERVEDP
jgi:hypothetical protein